MFSARVTTFTWDAIILYTTMLANLGTQTGLARTLSPTMHAD